MFSHATDQTTRPSLTGSFGMSASTHWSTTATCQSVLERGGNAFDAAVAGAFVLHLVEPHLNGPGGDMTGLFVAAEAPSEPHVLMGQGPAPAGATIEHYRSLGLEDVPGAGGLAAAVPGAVDAWLLLLRDRGTWRLTEVLGYAIEVAEQGHPILPQASAAVAHVAELFTDHWPTSAERWLADGSAPAPGTIITNPAYAAVMRRLTAVSDGADGRESGIDAARRAWKEDIVGPAVERFFSHAHRHADGGDYPGVMTAADVAEFSATTEAPATIRFRGHTIAKTGAWGQGPIMLQTLTLLEHYDDAELDPGTADGIHRILEAMKLALADRDVYYCDGEVPLEELLGAEAVAERRKLIGERASSEFRPSELPGGTVWRPPLVREDEVAAGAGAGEPTVAKSGARRGDTSHLDVVDRWGNMVSATPSGGWLQSSPTIPELGFCLGTRLQMTWLDEESPAALRPGVRPRTTLSPTMVLRDGQPIIALGTPGGDQQDQWQIPMLLRLLLGGHSAQQSIDAPTFHTTHMVGSFWPRTWDPAGVVVEDRIGDEVISELESRGHRVTRAGDWALGRLSCVTRDPATGHLSAGANPRGAQGYAAGR
ncbi:gamma-glutamyltransferase family protein [Nesterenkonia marinintestina]|uniref:gamma-glutamyltransferase family protein n=1 Tax=Nesterenkonia marinintestina TaxID=2979865 RepID=UPI0021BE3E20|nr:gamma-glutamyltransferase [Nesterenkonia sp. GX14115]